MKSIKTLIFLAALPVMFPGSSSAQPQIYQWSTIAGLSGHGGSADGANSAARFNVPACFAVDGGGTLYVTDVNNNTIRKLTPDGTNWITTTIAGKAGILGSADGTNSASRFNQPVGVTLDGSGNLYVTDANNNTIRKLTPDGTNWITTTIAGKAGVLGSADGTNGTAQFSFPTGIVLDGGGNLLVADQDNGTIRKLTPDGTNWVSSTIAGKAMALGSVDGTNSAARFTSPLCLTIDSGGNLFVTDILNNTIRKVAPVGTNWVTSTIAGKAGVAGIADGTNSAVRFNQPNSIGVDGGGNLFVTDQNNNTVRKLTPMGTNWVSSTIGGWAGHSGSADGTNSAARFTSPYGVAVDSVGNLYVGDGSPAIRGGVHLPVFQSVAQANGKIGLSWSAAPGQKLQLQFTSDLTSTNWTNLGNTMTATNGSVSASDTLGPDKERFYRILLVP